MPDVDPRLKPDGYGRCECGYDRCRVPVDDPAEDDRRYGRLRKPDKRTLRRHVYDCKCPSCTGRRNRNKCDVCKTDPCYCNTIVEGPLTGVNIDRVAAGIHGGLMACFQTTPTDYFEPCEGVTAHVKKIAQESARLAVEMVERELGIEGGSLDGD